MQPRPTIVRLIRRATDAVVWLVAAAVAPAFAGRAAAAPDLAGWALAQSNLCVSAIAAAEQRHGIPTGLLQAIATVETGRPLPPGGAIGPWPWSTDAAGAGAFYDTQAAAIAGAQAALSRSRNLDVGCMQVSLLSHPSAFQSLQEAFDPVANAEYAARYLTLLQQGPAHGDWGWAAGFYHSQSIVLATPYRAMVQARLAGRPLPRAGFVPLFRRAVQLGALRIELAGGALLVVRAGARRALPPPCEALPGGGVRCRVR